jgi:tetratricopeptide (TPR) repeat protein
MDAGGGFSSARASRNHALGHEEKDMSRSAFPVPILVFAALLLPSLVASAEAQTGLVAGTVRDVEGEPIVGAEVVGENTEWQRRIETTTNDSGRFSLIGLQRGRWLFLIRQRGYEPVQGFANVRGAGTARVNFVMETDPLHPPAPSTGVLANFRGDELEEALDAADALYDRGDYDAAIDAYEEVLVNVPRLSGLHVQIGHAYREKNDFDRALAAYRAVPAGDVASAEALGAIEALQSSVDR